LEGPGLPGLVFIGTVNFASVPVHLYRVMPAFAVGYVSFEPATGASGFGTLTVSKQTDLTESEARVLLETAIAAMQLVARGQVDPDYSRMCLNVAKNGERHVSMAFPAAATIVGAPYTDDEMASLRLALETMWGADVDVDAGRLELSLRWFRMATAESDVLPQFVMAWIALEALYRLDDNESSNTGGIHQRLEILYLDDPSLAQKASARIRKIYLTRNAVFHRADLGHIEISQAAKDTLAILRDCLRAELRLPPALTSGAF
jgi:hypothetical protein